MKLFLRLLHMVGIERFTLTYEGQIVGSYYGKNGSILRTVRDKEGTFTLYTTGHEFEEVFHILRGKLR